MEKPTGSRVQPGGAPVKTFALVVLVGALTGCGGGKLGGESPGQGVIAIDAGATAAIDATEERSGQLQGFGSWFDMGTAFATNAPTFVRGNGGWVGFMVGSQNHFTNDVEMNNTNASGTNWTKISDSSVITVLPGTVGAAVIPGSPDRYLIVVRAQNKKYFAQLRTISTVLMNWTSISTKLFNSSPSLTFNMSSEWPQRGMVLTGLGEDNVMYISTNILDVVTYNYHNGNWGSFGTIDPNMTFNSHPTIASDLCAVNGERNLYVAGRVADGSYYYSAFNGSFWTPYSQVENGEQFLTGPAIGVSGCNGRETTIVGLGLDNRLWASTQLGPGGSFNLISTRTFPSDMVPTANSVLNVLRIGGLGVDSAGSAIAATTAALSP